MNIKKMGGSAVYAKYIAFATKDYTVAPHKEKYNTIIDYYKIDGPANWGNNLFHYCPIDALKSITQNKQLRFTDVQYLADTTEFMHAIDLLKTVIKEQKNSINEELDNILEDEEIFKQLENYSQRYPFYQPINDVMDIDSIKPICKVHTCSLSLHGNLPNMWKRYAEEGNGVSIGFKKLKRHMRSEEKVKIIFGKVWYYDEDKKQCIEALLNDVCELFSLIPDKKCRKDMVQTVLISAMNNMRIFMKNVKYLPEDEYRAVLVVPKEIIYNNQLPEGYTKGVDNGKPFIDVPFASESISHILVGPEIKTEFSLMKIGLEDWFLKQNLNNINIYSSQHL